MKAKIPKSIKKYEPKIVAGMSWIQCLFLGLGFCVGIIFYKLFLLFLPIEVAILIAAIFALPIIACGFIKVSGLNFLQIVKIFIGDMFTHSGYRPYKTKGYDEYNEKK